MAEIRDQLVLDVDQALRSIAEIENALNRALSDIVLDVQTGPGLSNLDSDISDAAAATSRTADEAARLDRELRQADQSTESLTDELRDAERAADKVADETSRIDNEARKADTAFSGIAGSLKGVGLGIAAGLGGREIVRFLGDTVTAASDLAESINAVDVIFEEASETVKTFGADTSDAVFLAASDFNQLAANTGNLLKGFGLDLETAADLTILLTERSADMASVFNTEVSEALEAINSALRGETEQIRRFTGSFSVAEVQKFGQELFGVTGELTEQQKVLAAVEFILAKTAAVQGDAANTAGEFANQQRALNEQWTNAQAIIGAQLIPVLSDLLPLLIAAADAIPRVVRDVSDTVSISADLLGVAGNIGQSIVALGTGDLGQVANQFGDARDAAARFNDALIGSRSIVRDFQDLLDDGEDNALDYANALATVADRGDLVRLFDEITDAATAGGVGIEDQAAALQTLIREGDLTQQQLRFVVARFNELADALGRPELAQSAGTLNDVAAAIAGIADQQLGGVVDDFANIQFDANVAQSLLDASDASDTANESFRNSAFEFAAESAGRLEEQLADLPELVTAVGDATDTSNSGLFNMAEAFTEASEAADRFRTLTLELSDPVFAAAEAQERLADAEADLADTRSDSEATAQDRANAELEVAKAALEADAAARALGDVNIGTGRFAQSVGVIAAALGKTTEEVITLLDEAEILDDTDIGIQVDFLVEDDELETILTTDYDVTVGIHYQADNFPAQQQRPGDADNFRPGSGGGAIADNPPVQINTTIVAPQDIDIAGAAAQAGNIVGALSGATAAFRGK